MGPLRSQLIMNLLFSVLALSIELFVAILFAFLILFGDLHSAWQNLSTLFVIVLLGSLLITAKLQWDNGTGMARRYFPIPPSHACATAIVIL